MIPRLKRAVAPLLLALSLGAAPVPHAAPATPDPAAIVRDVLAQPAYRAVATTSVQRDPTLLNKILDWIGERISAAWTTFFRALRGAKDAGAAFGIALIIAVLALLVLVVVRLVTFFAAGSAPRPADARAAALVPRTSAAEWLARAREAAGRGEYGSAIAALFNAALRCLDERGDVPYDAARSPAEYRALVRARVAGGAPHFETIARRFILATFSRATPQREDYEAALSAYAVLAADPQAAK